MADEARTMAPPEDPPHRGRDGAIALAIGALALAAVLIGQPSSPTVSAPTTPASPAQDPSCVEWTNNCLVCIRRDEGPACSLPGIACTPGASTCTRHAP